MVVADSPDAPPIPLPGLPDNPDDAVDRNCRLLGPFALFVQAIMGFVVLGTLVLKRQREKPKRPWKIWLLDISKQMLGQLFVHSLNVLLSSLGSVASQGENNPCSLYFLNIAVDTTVGVLFIYYCVRFLTHYFTDVLGWPGFVSGQYTTTPSVIGRRRRKGPRRMDSGLSSADEIPATPQLDRQGSSSSVGVTNATASRSNRPRISFFLRQLALYLFTLLLMKILVLGLFALLPFLFAVGRWVLDLFGEHKRAQIFFVMALFPLAMNTLQFWLIDSVLRHDPKTSKYQSEEDARLAAGTSDRSLTTSVDLERESYDTDRITLPRHSLDEAGGGGPWTAQWWIDTFGGGSGGGVGGNGDRVRRDQYQAIDRHMIGEDSDEEGDGSSDDPHTYPPRDSQSSSVAQLDAADGGKARGNTANSSNGAAHAINGMPDGTSHATANIPTTSTSDLLPSTAEGGEEEGVDDEAWDAWSEDEEPKGKPKAD